MKIILVGGGTAGHFYPLMAVADKLKIQIMDNRLAMPKLYYFASKNYDDSMLKERNIIYSYVPSGKNRLYFSFQNFIDIFKLFSGVIVSFFKLLFIFPDVVFSKGGYDSVPTCLAAYLLRIPIIMHDSDSIPGRASLLISKLAHRVAVSYPQSIQSYSNTDIVAWIGQPMLEKYTPREDFKKDLDNERKNILITGGSQGSQKLNEVTLSILPQLISKYNIIHQTGGASIEDVKLRASVILENYNNSNYAPYANLDFSKAYPHLDLVIARAGSSIFEFIAWQIPSILVPIPENISRDQRSNALHASNMGYAKVIYEDNLSGSLLLNSIENILENKNIYETMRESCKKNYKKNASENIAKEIINICQSHS